MKKGVFISFVILLLFSNHIYAQNQLGQFKSQTGDTREHQEVPRISAYEAYQKYKAGKAYIIQAGGATFEKRHILGAFNVDEELIKRGTIALPPFPRSGIELFTYCY
jgi:hypothetical protein